MDKRERVIDSGLVLIGRSEYMEIDRLGEHKKRKWNRGGWRPSLLFIKKGLVIHVYYSKQREDDAPLTLLIVWNVLLPSLITTVENRKEREGEEGLLLFQVSLPVLTSFVLYPLLYPQPYNFSLLTPRFLDHLDPGSGSTSVLLNGLEPTEWVWGVPEP